MAAILPRQSVRSQRDAALITLALIQGALMLAWPSIPLIALGLWWNANTVSHNFIHRPFFKTSGRNRAFSCYLSLLLGFPHSLWRARHLAHHGGGGIATEPQRRREDLVATLLLWGALVALAPWFALTVYLPGFLIGMGLCFLQGRYEHSRGTVSHYGRIYNLLFFNDGYHVEHHARPGIHWSELEQIQSPEAASSRFPAALRWLECANLCGLERLVLRSPLLQRFVIERHTSATARLLADMPAQSIQKIGIIGGGLYPRTAIILKRLLPRSRPAIIDMSAENLEIARKFIGAEAEYINDRFDGEKQYNFDLLIIPLAFVGDREAIYRNPPAPVALVHDWIWKRRGRSVVVSWLLLKRLNLLTRAER